MKQPYTIYDSLEKIESLLTDEFIDGTELAKQADLDYHLLLAIVTYFLVKNEQAEARYRFLNSVTKQVLLEVNNLNQVPMGFQHLPVEISFRKNSGKRN